MRDKATGCAIIMGFLLLVALVVFGIASEIARGLVWIRWAFGG